MIAQVIGAFVGRVIGIFIVAVPVILLLRACEIIQ
jgi:hypothetical protein